MEAAIREYRKSGQHVSREQLIVDHVGDVQHILGRLLVALPDFVDRENLEAAGILGLVEAAHQFDPLRGTSFRTYSYHRIRGAILDELRRNCPLPQHVLEKWAVIRSAIDELDGNSSHEAIAQRCGLSTKEVQHCIEAVRLARPEEWRDEFVAADADLTFLRIDHEESLERLANAIERLDDRLRTIVSLYYTEDLRLKEIGEVLGLSESRVSRLMARAHDQLRILLQVGSSEE